VGIERFPSLRKEIENLENKKKASPCVSCLVVLFFMITYLKKIKEKVNCLFFKTKFESFIVFEFFE